MMEPLFCFRSDNDGHNYLIHLGDAERFAELLEQGEKDNYVDFNNVFETCRIDGIESWAFAYPKEI